MKKIVIIFFAVVIVICAAVMGFLTFGNSQKGSVEIIEDKSYLSDFVVQDGETRINCVLTFKNNSDKDITFSVKAHFTVSAKKLGGSLPQLIRFIMDSNNVHFTMFKVE